MSQRLVTSIAQHVWQTKYRHAGPDGAERDVVDTWRRVAGALAGVEAEGRDRWAERFYRALDGFRFLPGGRILAGAGTGRDVTLFNCFVMGTIPDSLEGILDALKEGAITMQRGGGVGYDFSTLRPRGTRARRTGTVASGPVSFMEIWDRTCATLLSTGARRGAMMATIRCDHPDVETFIEAKQRARTLTNFNLSVLVTDAFMEAVQHDLDWPLVFPEQALGDEATGAEVLIRAWPGFEAPVRCCVLRTVRAVALWERVVRAAFDHAEPGVLFIDRINRGNNLRYREQIAATNPCGEIPLPPYGACDLGSLNLPAFVHGAFEDEAHLDLAALADTASVAVRMLDDVIDLSRFPIAAQRAEAEGARRIGLGITGLADALIMLGHHYDSAAARACAVDAMRTVCHAAYRASVALAREKGAFPFFEAEPYLASPFVQALPDAIRDAIASHGIRNSHLTAIAPAGTISLLANGVSNGIEPVFAPRQSRTVLQADGRGRDFTVEDFACRQWQRDRAGLPPAYVDAPTLSPSAHLGMQAALQPYVDNAISKTINAPADADFDTFRSIYTQAYRLGLKGCTVFRPNALSGSVLRSASADAPPVHCCTPEREAD